MGCGGSKTNVEPAGASSSGSTAKEDVLEKKANQEDIRDKYELGKLLGSGSFGQVREAKVKDSGEVRAVKMIEPDKGACDEWSNHAIFVREVALLQQIQHENIIRYYDFYEDIHFLYVVMELCKGGEVFTKIVELKRFSEKDAARIGQQMLKSLDYIHKMCFAHRDIKAENFMLSDISIQSNIKMIDFGMATKFKPNQMLTELCGSPHYLSPEMIGQKYNHMADVWAFGVLMYLIMYGYYPYDAKHPRDIMVKIVTEPIKWKSKTKLSKEAIDFLTKLLEHDIKKRLTADQALDHPWIKKVNTFTAEEGEHLTENVRSAHKKITGLKKVLDPKLDELRNEKLLKIDEDFSKGIRHGQRLGETPQEAYMLKPEFLRRENKITTAPSNDINQRRNSLQNLINSFGGKKKKDNGFTITEEDEEAKDAVDSLKPGSLKAPQQREPGRSASMTAYLGGINKTDELNLQALFEERQKNGSLEKMGALSAVVPAGSPAPAPATEPVAKQSSSEAQLPPQTTLPGRQTSA